ncbi:MULTISPECIES: L-fuconate dehydratase [Xanthomonas]|uniref:L-fuconate dehydratase n=1 Tax=Xanthomonas TaxID=338 RepID=UPI0002266C25|nr:L-fuconate dehydratase [Xanthomonas euvesicatoria]AEO44296.1 L-alanine-DL-glutamate epimerase [Xanthomonas euvesicatoria pv. citrumelo F1]MBV6862886.1 L-fuconate dehydratase [Xanthomonas campestris pv. blepharidis]MBV6868763.1 L-fuconate dehydratase [Xanthomonas campestris pv. veroniae]MDO7933680.1 L-fuconate dehydratase [Xanthomonas euvesicatoria pv. eucalypti]MDO7938454.1 L-fuconate dehydratase [Xanthomonas euvesicatoria pv. eucalypti]
MRTIIALETHDVRFPTSRELDGSDAMNPDPDYSAAYVVLRTDAADDLAGYGLVFTIGRGNDVQTAAVAALAEHVIGLSVDEVIADLGAFARRLTNDSQLRWLGPEKGVMHMAIGAVINAAWDLAARAAKKPLWRFIAELTPEQLVDTIDFRYLTDALTRDEALAILRAAQPQRAQRIAQLIEQGYPAYTTSPGWLGYSDEKLVRLAKEAVADGFRTIKLKVGANVRDDIRRCRLAREAIGPDIAMAVDANQRWDVGPAIDWMRQLAEFDIAWIEEPTSPDDVLGHAAIRQGIAPVPVSTGEHTQNRVVFKQLLQAGAVDLIQIDAARVGGVNENLAILLLAAKFNVRVFPHAGGVGLCELVQHLAMADFVAITGKMEDRAIEFVDHLHQHFLDPVRIRHGRYLAPEAAGFSAQMHAASIAEFSYPGGRFWVEDLAASAKT